MENKKSNLTFNLILIILAIVGLSFLLYPSVSDYWNSFHQTQAVANYSDKVANLDEKEYKKIWEDAVEYNKSVDGINSIYSTDDERLIDYEKMLNVDGNGIMGYIEIPTINCSLPIYHGTDDAELQVAVGHLEWTSLPIGGQSTHCVISGHRGLPSANLFSDLDRLTEGDIFLLRVLDEVLTYEVDQILIVEPEDISALGIEPGKDYCTLVTCTPYAVNTHRLLVRGHRVANAQESSKVYITADATQIEPVVVAPIVALPMLLVLLIILLVKTRKRK